ncbi:MAG: IS1634 family transposase [Planctomycetota bacterium]|nr:MAG: IS1634 family transposase [Planctomycetota bacterium]
MKKKRISAETFDLAEERLGPLPIVNHFLDKLGLEKLFEKFVPTTDRRCTLPYARALGVLVRSIVVEREPIYRHYETVNAFSPSMFGLTRDEANSLKDDQLGRALDRLFDADRGSLLTDIVVRTTRVFDVQMEELHNDSTTIRYTGQYRLAKGRSIRGRRAPYITFGHSKDRRPDLKQLLFVLTTSCDGGIPVQFRCEAGNVNDATTHIETWEALRKATGKTDFLYVGDSKLCCYETLRHIDLQGGRLITVMPRSRVEDGHFRKWIQKNTPEWELVWDRPNARKKYGPRDRWYVYKYHSPSQEAWPIVWVWSTHLAQKQKRNRSDRLEQAKEELQDLDRKLKGRRPRLRSRKEIGDRIDEILKRLKVQKYLRAQIWQEEIHRFRQETRGRPGPHTRYRRETRRRPRIRWEIDQAAVEYDEKSDGMYPLLTNDRSLTPRQVLEAHKRQPTIEKRFEQIKTVHEIAPVFLKNEGRIEALFFLYFVSLLVQALIEREIRRAMKREGIEELPIYPEERPCKRPTAQQVLRLFAHTERHHLLRGDDVVQIFEPKLTDIQRQVLKLLGVPIRMYTKPS